MHPNLQDTIVALSSAPFGANRSGARAILRITGPQTFSLARRLFEVDPGEPDWPGSGDRSKSTTWRCVRGALRWRELRLPACAYLMPGPRSYTRQDVVEIHLLAMTAVLNGSLAFLRECGARLASPGEFTRRALLLGRLSFAQAEAVGELIRATTAERARSWAARAVREDLTPPARLREEIANLLTHLELGLDFSLEDVTLLPREELARQLDALVRAAVRFAREDGPQSEGLTWGGAPRVVLLGPTGAGKSTLLNAMVGRSAALISDAGHTTRDPVEVLHEIEPGLRVCLADTAGLDLEGSGTSLVRQALAQTERAVRAADVLLIVLAQVPGPGPGNTQLADCLANILGENRPAAVALVWNKRDLPRPESWLEEAEGAHRALGARLGLEPFVSFQVSATTGEGMEPLRAFIGAEARNLVSRLGAAWSSGLAAQCVGYRAASEALVRAAVALKDRLGEDAIAVELREAMHALSDAQGVLLRHDALTESLLDRIFSRFCVGK